MRSRSLIIPLVLLPVIAATTFQQSCSKENVSAPSITLQINPADGDAFERGSTVVIAVEVKEPAPVRRVIICIDNLQVHASEDLPCEYHWDTGEETGGNHTISIEAAGENGSFARKEVVLRIYELNDQPCPCAETVTDYDGNTYSTIQIGEQCWMKENLKVTHFADGTPLMDGTGAGNTQYDTLTKYYFNYNDDESHADTYGRLYIWMAAVNGEASGLDLNPSQVRGVCPEGWHLPSDSEWRQLEMFLGMPESEATDREWRGTIEGGMLKERATSHWTAPNAGATNESGFTALPAGHRNMTGDFYGLGTKASFWSSTNHIAYNMTQNPAFRMLHYDESRTYRYRGFHGYLTYARSVRCVKDQTAGSNGNVKGMQGRPDESAY